MLKNTAYIGPNTQRADSLGVSLDNVNNQSLLNYYHYYRAYKTGYELACMRREAHENGSQWTYRRSWAFQAELSEFDINMAYLMATGHRDTDVPYGNIVALNEHAAVLHYTKLNHQSPDEYRSFLIDAGQV